MNINSNNKYTVNESEELSIISPIDKVEFEYRDGYLSGGVRKNEGTVCWITLENGFSVNYFSQAGFGCSKKEAERECLNKLKLINKYLEREMERMYVK